MEETCIRAAQSHTDTMNIAVIRSAAVLEGAITISGY